MQILPRCVTIISCCIWLRYSVFQKLLLESLDIDLFDWVGNSAIWSILADPFLSYEHIKEAIFLKNLKKKHGSHFGAISNQDFSWINDVQGERISPYTTRIFSVPPIAFDGLLRLNVFKSRKTFHVFSLICEAVCALLMWRCLEAIQACRKRGDKEFFYEEYSVRKNIESSEKQNESVSEVEQKQSESVCEVKQKQNECVCEVEQKQNATNRGKCPEACKNNKVEFGPSSESPKSQKENVIEKREAYNSLSPSNFCVCFLLNPINVATSLALSMYSFYMIFLLGFISLCLAPPTRENKFIPKYLNYLMMPQQVLLAISLYLMPDPLILFTGILLLELSYIKTHGQKESLVWDIPSYQFFSKQIARCLVRALSLLSIVFLLHFLSFVILGSQDYLIPCLLDRLTYATALPDIGFYWCLNQLHSESVLTAVFVVLPALAIITNVSIFVRIRRFPGYCGISLSMTLLLFKLHHTPLDFVLFIMILLLDYPTINRTPIINITLFSACGSLVLFLTSATVWLKRLTASENFIFFNQVFYGFFCISVLTNQIEAVCRFAIIEESATAAREPQSERRNIGRIKED